MATDFLKDLVGKPAEAILDNLSNLGDKYLVLEQLIPRVNEMLTDQAKEMRQLNKELGTGSKTSAELRQSFAKLSREIGVATSNIYELVSQTKEYHQGVQETTASTLKFIKASGASSDIVAKFSAKLSILGKASNTSFTNMYESILSVRDAYGLTDSQIDNIITSLENYAVVTGASNEQMEKASVTLAKFTSQLTSAGMAADDVSEIINGMLDPDKMTDNLALMSKLGISLSDMVSGDPLDALDGAADKLKKLSQEIVSISKTNRIQANEVAKVYGLTLEQASTLANMDTSENALNTQKKLEQYRQEMTTFTESIGNTINVLSGIVSGPLLAVGKIIEGFGNTLGMLPRGISALLVAFKGKKILNALTERLGEAAKNFGKNVGETMSQYLNQVDKRSENKKRDAGNLSPKSAKNNLDYGFGWNYLIKAEKRAASQATVNKGSTSITGEMVENMQSMWNQIKELKRYGESLSKNSYEYQAFKTKYGGSIETFEETYGEFFGNVARAQQKGNEWGTAFSTDYNKLTQKNAKEKFANTLRNNLSNVGINLNSLGFVGDAQKDKLMKLANQSKGPKEFLEKLSDFYAESEKTPEVSKYIEQVSIGLTNLNSSAQAAVGSVAKYNDTMSEGAELLNGKKASKDFKGGFGKFFQGLKQNVQTLFKSINPGKMILGGLGGITALLGTKVFFSLSKNEKFQESMSKISEKFSTMFDGLITNIEPAITSIANALSSFLDFINPAVEAISSWLSKGASWLSGKLDKTISNISDSVATIEDSYKQEDLKTMVAASGYYDAESDSIVVSALGEIQALIKNVVKNQETGNDLTLLSAANV
jgi:hypothetical protein